MIMMVKTPGSQVGSPASAEEGGEEVGGGRWESGERCEVQARSTLTSTAPKARSRSGEVATPVCYSNRQQDAMRSPHNVTILRLCRMLVCSVLVPRLCTTTQQMLGQQYSSSGPRMDGVWARYQRPTLTPNARWLNR